jgi:hypothetical protein
MTGVRLSGHLDEFPANYTEQVLEAILKNLV